MHDCDIRLLNGEITLNQVDFELVYDEQTLIQDIKEKLYTDVGALFYDLHYGTGILRYIHSPQDELTLLKLKQQIQVALKQDPRINKDSIHIQITPEAQQLTIQIDFQTKTSQSLSLIEKI
ncbi:MAG: GPW/gp25 family protein [Brevinema sp.]